MGGTDQLIKSGHRVGVELTSAEVAELAGGIGGASVTIDAEGDTAANVFRCSVQLLDKNTQNLRAVTPVRCFIAALVDGIGVGTAPSGGIAAGSVGVVLNEPLANQILDCQTDANGLLELDLTDVGTPTLFMVVQLPDGRQIVGPEMTWV